MSNDHIKSEISAYLAGGLPEARNRQIDAHVAECEKCRQAVSKMRGKLARGKREALKKASPDPLPNLFLARQGKVAGVDRPPSKAPWVIFFGILFVGLAYGLLKHFSILPHEETIAAPLLSEPAVDMSSAPVPSTATVAAAPTAPVQPAPVQRAPVPVTPVQKPVPAVPVQAAPAPPVSSEPKPSRFPIKVSVKQEWKGTESGIKDSRLVVVRNDKAWDGLWTEMQISGPAPLIDFDREVVVSVFAGARAPGTTISMGKIIEMEDEEVVPYHISGPEVAVSTMTTAPVPAQSYPYLLSLIARVDKKIRMTRREVLE